MPGKPGTKLLSGSTEVVTAQTAVQLSSTGSEIACLGVFVSLAGSATGTIAAIGGSKTTTEAKKELGKEKGIIIEKKMAPLFIEVSDLSAIWVDVEKSKDIVTWLAVLA